MESPVEIELLREIAMTTQSVLYRENVLMRPRRVLRDRLLATLGEWMRRMSSRRELAALSELELKDLGYPASAAAERAKPFWRA